MESLLALLDKIQQISPLPFFSKETIIVQNAGMQHWLNMSLAEQRGISMNIDYALPAQFLWKLIRSLASDEIVPEQSPYSREVLTWRIYHLLASDKVLQHEAFVQVNQYWQGGKATENSIVASNEQALLKRYQLAQQLADLYEQYLIFRPDWIDSWSQGIVDQPLDGIEHQDGEQGARWQGLLWQMLTEHLPYNPKELIANAIDNMATKKALIPERISFFGINAMAPIWLEFIAKLSEHTQIHFFHLNPCYNYWGDIQSEKQAFKTLEKWTQGFTGDSVESGDFNDQNLVVGNPLLANLGQQGREFLALLQEHSTIDIEAFDTISEQSPPQTLLTQIQQDILTLTDAREQAKLNAEQGESQHSHQESNKANNQGFSQDESILVSSCHSALREVQGLHDWLLHQFNQDKNLTPKDVIVMCPQIEHYAPYVDAVFTRGWQDLDDNIPPLPCSIADRISKDAEPIIAAFLDILQLPDSRFKVGELVALLRLPAMAGKFNLSEEEVDKISVWLEQASIHWGLDQAHKEQILKTKPLSNSFTWQQGLSRLLRGFAFGDASVIYQQQLLLPTVEGSDGELLGKLMLIIEHLQYFSQQLATARTANQWQEFLFSLLDELFLMAGERSFEDISTAIKQLSEYCFDAKFSDQIPLIIVRDFLNNHFSQPDPGRQFMIGQVTFCSMVPMRSIPFKVVAILGLNDGEFPRQRQALGFDLLANAKARLGDRSRRGDDRYLFLEAIISARQALYLSYQGRNIKNNTERQPSIVLKEFCEYLHLAYGWQAKAEQNSSQQQGHQKSEDLPSKLVLRQLPMQAFSLHNYTGRFPSFDQKWLALNPYQQTAQEQVNKVDHGPLLIKHTNTDSEHKKSDQQVSDSISLDAADLVVFYQHPAKAFAKQQLKLNFTHYETELADVEPFLVNSLESYLLRQALLNAYLGSDNSEQACAQVLTTANLSGKFPDLPTTSEVFSGWQNDSEQFAQLIIERDADNPEVYHGQCMLDVMHPVSKQKVTCIINVALPIKNNKLVFYRSSSAKAKDKFNHYLHQLLLQHLQLQASDELAFVDQHIGLYFDTKSQKTSEINVATIADFTAQLTHLLRYYLLGQHQALLLNSDLGEKAVNTKRKPFTQQEFEQFWQGANSFNPFGADPYIHYFWPQCPDLAEHLELLSDTYQPMATAVQAVKQSKSSTRSNVKGAKA